MVTSDTIRTRSWLNWWMPASSLTFRLRMDGRRRNEASRAIDLGKEPMGRKSGKVERSFRFLLDHGKIRRTTLSGRERISKRRLMGAFAFKLSIDSWHVHGIGILKQHVAGKGSVALSSWLFQSNVIIQKRPWIGGGRESAGGGAEINRGQAGSASRHRRWGWADGG